MQVSLVDMRNHVICVIMQVSKVIMRFTYAEMKEWRELVLL